MADKIMRLGIVSDSHGDLQSLRRAYRQMGEVDLVFHLGDHYRDGIRLGEQTGATVIGVKGNCDPHLGSSGELIELSGVRFYLTHGHTMGVKIGMTELVKCAACHKYDVVLFGHTHVPHVFNDRGILFVNPGSTAYPRHASAASFALVTIEDGKVEVELRQLAD